MHIRGVKRGLFGFLALVLLSAALLSGFALTTHTCADCAPGRVLCPYAVKLRDGLQQFGREAAAIFGISILLALLQAAISSELEKGNISTPVLLKARMNN